MLDNPIKRIVGVIICIASVAPIKSSPDKTINVSFANKIKKIVSGNATIKTNRILLEIKF